MASSIIPPKFRAFNDAGAPLAFGKVYTYQSGTNIPKATYTSEDGTVANANPVILNANGYADIYLEGSYKIVVKDANDVEMWTADPVTSAENQGTEWVHHHVASKYSASQIKVADNVTDIFHFGRRVRIDAGNIYYGDVEGSFFNGTDTIITVLLDTGASVPEAVVSATLGIISAVNSSQPSNAFLEALKGNDSTSHLSYTATKSLKAKIIEMDNATANNGTAITDLDAEVTAYKNSNDGLVTSIEQDVAANTAAISAGAGGIIGFATKADMDADLAHDENVLAQVVIDPTPGNNGLYIKVGASGAGSWSPSTYDRVQDLDDRIDVIEGEVELSGIYNDAPLAEIYLDRNAQLVHGDVLGDKAFISTFSGWKVPVTYSGESFELVKVYFTIEAPANVTVVIEDDAQNILTSTNRKIYGSGWHFFKLPIKVTSGLVPGSVIHVGFSAGTQTRMMPPNSSFPSNHPDFGIYDVYYTATDGTGVNEWRKVTEGSEATWPIAFRLFIIEDASYVSTSQLETDFYNVVQVIDDAKYDSITTTFAVTGALSAIVRSDPFAGWAALFDRVAGKSFNVVRLPQIARSIDTNDETQKWTRIVLTVHNGNTSSAALATATLNVDPEANVLYDLEFVLIDPTTLEPITLDENNLPAQYAISYMAYNSQATKAVAGESLGTISNFAGLSYYQTRTGGSWATYTDNPSLGIESYLAVNPEVISAYKLKIGGDSGGGSGLTTELVCAENIYSVDGKEMSVYFDNLTYHRYMDFLWNVTCSVGKQQDERFTVTAATGGVYPITIEAVDPVSHAILDTYSGNMNVASSLAGSGKNPKCLFIGDSTTAAGKYTGELVNMFASDVMDATLIGTINSGPGNYHEGRGGWTVAKYYTDATSPFVFSGAFDFQQYMNTNDFTGVDWVFFHLGINDVFGQTTDAGVNSIANGAVSQLDAMITNMKAYDPTIKFGMLVTIPPSAHQDAFGDNYQNGQTQWRYKRNIMLFAKTFISAFAGRTGENIHVVPFNVNLDTEHNMVASEVAANSRTTRTVYRQGNGVHPADEGYNQMADVAFSFLKYQEQ